MKIETAMGIVDKIVQLSHARTLHMQYNFDSDGVAKEFYHVWTMDAVNLSGEAAKAFDVAFKHDKFNLLPPYKSTIVSNGYINSHVVMLKINKES